MSKLFKLKEWLTLPDVAKHLSISFGEEVSEADVLRLALDGHLKLSIHLTNSIPAKSAKIIHISETNLNSVFDTHRLPGTLLSVKADEIFYLYGILDLPMIKSEKIIVELKCTQLMNQTPQEIPLGNSICVEDEGQLYLLQQRFADPIYLDFKDGDSEQDIQKKSALAAYIEAQDFPPDTIFIVRTAALREFEQSVNSTSKIVEKPLGTKERNSLLTIIAALCDYSAIDLNGRETVAQIEKMTDEIAAPVGNDTIRTAIKQIPNALESRRI